MDENGNPIDPSKNTEGNDPLMQFDKLWQDEPDDPNNPKPKKPSTFLPEIDNKKLGEMLGKMDFTKSITPEQLQNINGGGEKATQTLLEVINSATRQALAVAFQSSSRMTERGLSTAQDRFLDRVPDRVKDIMISNGLTNSSVIMKDPAYAPMVDGVRSRFQQRYPKATPAQIEGAVNKYFDDMAVKISGAKSKKDVEPSNQDKLRKGAGDADWDAWLDTELQKDTEGNEITI